MFYSYSGRRHPKIFNVLFYLSNKAPVIPVDTRYFIIALKGMADLKKRKERGQKSQCKTKERQLNPCSHIREVCYPQGAIVE